LTVQVTRDVSGGITTLRLDVNGDVTGDSGGWLL
jgi:hypothetical protein